MDKEQLINSLSQPIHFKMVATLVNVLQSNEVNLADIFEISLYPKKEVAFRAAWMLEFLLINKPQVFVIHINTIINYLPLTSNQSVMRHYSKMISLLTDKKVNSVYLPQLKNIDFNPIIEVLFKWLVDDSTLVATKVHCMQALANLSRRFEWMVEDLMDTILFLESKESIAFFARAKSVKKTLLKQMKNT